MRTRADLKASIEPPKFKNGNVADTLTWPRNSVNPISKDLNFTRDDALGHPYKGTAFDGPYLKLTSPKSCIRPRLDI